MQGRETVTDLVLRAVKRHILFRHYMVFYFGSRVSGGATARKAVGKLSDVLKQEKNEYIRDSVIR